MGFLTFIQKSTHKLFGNRSSKGLGTINGVYVPVILQMIGVILFMRLGWLTGNVGIYSMLTIIAISSAIILITCFSMTSIVSNMKVGAGGSYYIISRSLGIVFGSSIGILLCIAQLASIALCISGFSVSLHVLIPHISVELIEVCALVGIALISYFSTNLALKTQMLIFVVLGFSVFSLFEGSGSNIPDSIVPLKGLPNMGFWGAFALFFPALTGLEGGLSLSGDLKNPSKSLPLGSFAATITAIILYSSVAIFLYREVPNAILKSHPMIAYHVAKWSFLIMIGIWGATLSSALGSILGAPRTMQATARDGILPKFLAKGSGEKNEPRIATIVVFFLATVLTLLTDINQIIPILSMICLVTYGMINFVAFFEALTQNPSWRPSFKTPWPVSLLGSMACFMSMFLIHAPATFIVLFLVIILCFWAGRREIQADWDDIRYSILSFFVRQATTSMSSLEKGAKSWRPNILAMIDPDLKQQNLIHFANCINQARGFLTFGTIVPEKNATSNQFEEIRQSIKSYFEKQKISSFVHINPYNDYLTGMISSIKNYGIGPLRPNTIIIPYKKEQLFSEKFCQFIQIAYHLKKNIIILKDEYNENSDTFSKARKAKEPPKMIDVWWKGSYPKNFELSLAITHLLQGSKIWDNSQITIKTIVKSEEARDKIIAQSNEYNDLMRLKNLYVTPFVDESDDFYSSIVKFSQPADLTFIGIRPPKDILDNVEEYVNYYLTVFEKTKDLHSAAYVLAGEKINFKKIFHG